MASAITSNDDQLLELVAVNSIVLCEVSIQTLYNIIGSSGCCSLTPNVTVHEMSSIISNFKNAFDQWGHVIEITTLVYTKAWYGTSLAHIHCKYHCH